MNDCLFCKISKGEIPSYTVWESDTHMAFLTPFPNTEGFTVIITKEHHQSYIADLSSTVRHDLIDAACLVAKQIDRSFEDVGRTGIMFEGFGVDHIHAKLFPMHGTSSGIWEQRDSKEETYFDTYAGYISSHDAPAGDPEKLEKVAEKIKASL